MYVQRDERTESRESSDESGVQEYSARVQCVRQRRQCSTRVRCESAVARVMPEYNSRIQCESTQSRQYRVESSVRETERREYNAGVQN